jgi:HD-like signal output (HDOD) protein
VAFRVSSQDLEQTGLSLPTTQERQVALERLFARIGDVATLPSVAQKVLQLTTDENADAERLREAIQSDPVLVARILRRLNSSYYGLSQRISDIKAAIAILGMREIRNLAVTVFVGRLFDGGSPRGTYKRENLWSHSVGVAVAARLVARVCGHGACEEAYIAGLLHDLGFILLDQTLRRHFFKVLDALDDSTPTPIVENRLLGFDHAALGGFVARKWNFPESVAEAITFHHQPCAYEGAHKDLVNVVAVANYLCTRAGVTSLGIANVPQPPEAVYGELGLDQVTLAIIWEELDTALEKASALASA